MAELTEEQKEAQAEGRKLIHSYQGVFGVEGMRTPQQAAVWADMKHRAYIERPVFQKDGAGHLDPLRAALADGMRVYFLQIMEILKGGSEPRPPPKVIK